MDKLTNGLRAFATERRVALLGIAPIDRFGGLPANHHPRTREVFEIALAYPLR